MNLSLTVNFFIFLFNSFISIKKIFSIFLDGLQSSFRLAFKFFTLIFRFELKTAEVHRLAISLLLQSIFVTLMIMLLTSNKISLISQCRKLLQEEHSSLALRLLITTKTNISFIGSIAPIEAYLFWLISAWRFFYKLFTEFHNITSNCCLKLKISRVN